MKAEAKQPRCQPWRLPKYKDTVIYAGKKSTTIQKMDGFEYFCPACNVSFASHFEYQSHLILRERAKPYEEGLREVAKQIKDSSFHNELFLDMISCNEILVDKIK